MRCPEKLIESAEAIVLESEKLSPAQITPVLSHGLPSLYRSAYRLLGNKADAEDAVQDALLAGCEHLKQFRAEAQLSTWLTAIVINCARMQLRRRLRRIHVSLDSRIGEQREYLLSDTLMDERPNPEDQCNRSRLKAKLMKSAARLSPTLRRTFHLLYVDNLSVVETARRLGVPTNTVKSQLNRARVALLRAMRVPQLGPAEGKCCSPSDRQPKRERKS